MSSTLVLLLLVLALVLPVIGAAILRLLIPRLSAVQFYVGAAVLFAIAVGSVLLLARNQISDVQVGSLTLVLPDDGGDSGEFNVDSLGLPPVTNNGTTITGTLPITTTEPFTPTEPLTATAPLTETVATVAAPTSAPEPTSGVTATLEPTAAPTATSTAEPEPTAAPTSTPEPTAAPTAAPTAPPPTAAPAARRTYRVKKGDTLRSIADQFNVSVDALLKANNLTAKQADALRIDQELVIP